MFSGGLMRALLTRLAALSTVGCLMTASPFIAQAADDDGLIAGSILLRGRVIGIIPEDSSSSIRPIGGRIHVDPTVSPEVDLSYFLTDHIAIEGEAGVLQSSLSAKNTAFGDVMIGKVWSAPIDLTLQYHLLPHSRFNPYVGAGLNVTSYFGEQAAGGLVQNFSVDTAVGAVLEIGADYRISGPWHANVDVKQLLLGAQAHIDNGTVDAKDRLNPLILAAGIGYQF
jgi:outer membrane protein